MRLDRVLATPGLPVVLAGALAGCESTPSSGEVGNAQVGNLPRCRENFDAVALCRSADDPASAPGLPTR
jgi:hypothetical protein